MNHTCFYRIFPMGLVLCMSILTANTCKAEPAPYDATLIFAGSSIGLPVLVGSAAKTIHYSAVVPVDDDSSFIQINLASGKGSVWISDLKLMASSKEGPLETLLEADFSGDDMWTSMFHVVDLKKIGVKYRTDQNTLKIDIPKRMDFPWDVQLCSRKIKLETGKTYTVSFNIRTTKKSWPVTSYLMRMNPLRFYASSGRDMFIETSRLAVSDGVKVISPLLRFPWFENGTEKDFVFAGQYMDRLVQELPQSQFLLRLNVEPPAWWRKQNPKELLTWENGKTSQSVCVASEKWRTDVRKHLKRVIGYLESRWSDRIYGYIPMAQNTGEWYYPIWRHSSWGTMNHSPVFLEGYRNYLKKKYGTLDQLNHLWPIKLTQWDDVTIPSKKTRQEAKLGIFRHPQAQLPLIDFSEYQQVAMVEALENVAKTIKQSSKKNKPVLAFYGYTFEMAGLKQGGPSTGHLGLERILKSPFIDGIVDIVSYTDRGVGGTGSTMVPIESIHAAGKMVYTEDDTRTHLSALDAGFARTTNPIQTRWVLSRNLARSLVHHNRTWKYDLYGQGWFHEPSLWKNLIQQKNNFQALGSRDLPHDIAVVVDEQSLLYVKRGTELTKPLLYDMRYALGRMGTATPSWWLLKDLENGVVPAHKLTIILNAFYMSREQRQKIRASFEKQGGTVLWFFAPGYLTPQGPSLDAMKELTGLTFETYQGTPEVQIDFSSSQKITPWLKDFNLQSVAWPKTLVPNLAIIPKPGVQILGRYYHSQKPAIAGIQTNGFKSIFWASPVISPQALSSIAQAAGIHQYTKPGNVLITNGQFFSFTASGKGRHKIVFPDISNVHGVEGKIANQNGVKQLNIQTQNGEHVVFWVQPMIRSTPFSKPFQQLGESLQ